MIEKGGLKFVGPRLPLAGKLTLDTETLVQQLTEVERLVRLGSAHKSEKDHPTIASEGRDVLFPVRGTDKVDDDVDAGVLGDLGDLFGKILGLVVDSLCSTVLLDVLALLVRARCGDDQTRIKRLCELNRSQSDARGACVDEDFAPGLHL